MDRDEMTKLLSTDPHWLLFSAICDAIEAKGYDTAKQETHQLIFDLTSHIIAESA